MCAVDGLHGSGRPNTEYTIQERCSCGKVHIQSTCARTQSPTHLCASAHVVFGVVHKYIYRYLCNRSTKEHVRVEADIPKIKDVCRRGRHHQG